VDAGKGAGASSAVAHRRMSLADVSLLGLQRSAKIVRRPPPREELSLDDVSLLGLQRSAKIVRRAPPREEVMDEVDENSAGSIPQVMDDVDENSEGSIPQAMDEVDEHSEGLSFKDVSLLGLQRSVKIDRRQPPKDSAASPAAGGSLLGLQRSMQLKPGRAPGTFMRKTTVPLVEDEDP